MPPTPVDDHTEEFEQLAGLAALDVLEGDEQRRFEDHAAHCERCQVMLRLDREALARAAPEMDPSPDFKARLMQRAAQELSEELLLPTAEGRGEGRLIQFPWWRRTPRWASAIAAVFVLGVIAAGGYSYQNQVVASYPLSGSLAGTAVVTIRRSGAAELNLRVVNPPPGQVYEAWVIPPGGAPVPAGLSPTGDATIPLSGVGSGTTVAITRERQRVDAPTDLPPPMAVQL
jgi:anti-sigma-K factor RskA